MSTVNVEAAFESLPNVSDVTYAIRTGSYPQLAYEGNYTIAAFRTRISVEEPNPSGGFYRQFRASFKLSIGDLGDFNVTPSMGDRISDQDGFDWNVIHSHKGLASWTVGAVRFDIGSDRVDWRRVDQETNDYGDRITDILHSTSGGVFDCRMQPATSDILDLFGKKGAKNHFACYLLSDIVPQFGDLLVQEFIGGAESKLFVIRDWRSREDIQNALILLCEVLP